MNAPTTPAPAPAPATPPAAAKIPRVNVRADRVRLAASCMAQMDIRYYLNGVYVEPRPEGGAFIVATDGHRLMAVIDETGECSEPVILRITKDMVRRLPKPSPIARETRDALSARSPSRGKARRAAKEFMLTSPDGNRISLDEFRGKPVIVLSGRNGEPAMIQGDNPLVAGKFPDWRRVMRRFEELKPGTTECYNHEYLIEPLQAFARTGRFDAKSISTYQAEKGSAIVFHIHGHEYALLIIMPMRGDDRPIADMEKLWGAHAGRPAAARPAPERQAPAANDTPAADPAASAG